MGGGRTGKAALLGRACSAARVGVRLSHERQFSSGVKFSGSGGEPRRALDHRRAFIFHKSSPLLFVAGGGLIATTPKPTSRGQRGLR